MNNKNDLLSPFYPLQNHKEMQKVIDITKDLEDDFKYIVDKTKSKSSAVIKQKIDGGRKRRSRRLR